MLVLYVEIRVDAVYVSAGHLARIKPAENAYNGNGGQWEWREITDIIIKIRNWFK